MDLSSFSSCVLTGQFFSWSSISKGEIKANESYEHINKCLVVFLIILSLLIKLQWCYGSILICTERKMQETLGRSCSHLLLMSDGGQDCHILLWYLSCQIWGLLIWFERSEVTILQGKLFWPLMCPRQCQWTRYRIFTLPQDEEEYYKCLCIPHRSLCTSCHKLFIDNVINIVQNVF